MTVSIRLGVFSKVVSSIGLDVVQKSLGITSECPFNICNLEREQCDVKNVDDEMVEIGDQNRDILSPYQGNDQRNNVPSVEQEHFLRTWQII